MPRKSQPSHSSQSVRLKQWLVWVLTTLVALCLSVCAVLAYMWLVVRPSEAEGHYIHPISDALTYQRAPFLLKDALPWAWDRACVAEHPHDLGVAVDMSRASTGFMRNNDTYGILVFFYKDQKPWGIRIERALLPPVKTGACIDESYVFPTLPR